MKTHNYFFMTELYNIFMRQTLTDYFGGVTQKCKLRFPLRTILPEKIIQKK